jgi:CRISPR/Cas system CSM-associated protein Csm2 small subunit
MPDRQQQWREVKIALAFCAVLVAYVVGRHLGWLS